MGDWSGTWYSTKGSGSINMTFVESAYGTPRLENFQLTSTSCAEGGFSDGAPFDINNPVFEILMSDGSEMEVEQSATESVSMLGGNFYIDSGPCEAAEGMYYMFRN